MSDSNFIDNFKRQRPTDGRDRTASVIRKMHRSGPGLEAPSDVTADNAATHASINAIKKAHAAGPRPLYDVNGHVAPMVKRKSETLARQVARSVRKALALPPQSDNAEWDDVIADTAASNNWHDEPADRPQPEDLGGFNDRAASLPEGQDDGNGDQTVKALKAIYAKGPRDLMS